MPHISIEYTKNLTDRINPESIIDTLHSTAQRLGVFPHWGIRTFATTTEDWRVADDIANGSSGYVHVRVKVAAGREAATIDRIVDELHSALNGALAEVCTVQPVGFQLEIYEFNPVMTRSGGSIPGSPTVQQFRTRA